MSRFKDFVLNMYGPTLMSRCTIFCWCKYWIACTNWKKISFMCDSCSDLTGCTRVVRSPPSMNSSTMKREEGVSTTSSVWITQGWQNRKCITPCLFSYYDIVLWCFCSTAGTSTELSTVCHTVKWGWGKLKINLNSLCLYSVQFNWCASSLIFPTIKLNTLPVSRE
jgi:hypothetical protein